jgi:hypothetical protein
MNPRDRIDFRKGFFNRNNFAKLKKSFPGFAIAIMK